MNSIFIHDLRVETRIGVYDWEQHLAQTLRLDIELGLPVGQGVPHAATSPTRSTTRRS